MNRDSSRFQYPRGDGLPLPQMVYERVYAAERTANEAPELALTKRLIVMRAQIENYLGDEGEITEKMEAFNRIRNNFGFMVVGEDENVQQIDTSLNDFDALVMTQYQLVAALARTPATKLLGTSPNGFIATGEHESDSYDQELVSIQENGMTPLLERHYEILCRSRFSEYPGLTIRPEWNPVRKLKPMELTDVNLKKAQIAQAEQSLGAIDGADERARLIADPDSGYAGMEMERAGDDALADIESILAGGEVPGDAGIPGVPGMDAKDANGMEHDKDGKFGKGGGGGASSITSPEEKQAKIDSIKVNFQGDTTLPGLNAEELEELGKPDKPVLLKKNILDRNESVHPEVKREKYGQILGEALNRPDDIITGRNREKPYFNFLSHLGGDSNATVLIELEENKDNYEVVHWHWATNRKRAKMKKGND